MGTDKSTKAERAKGMETVLRKVIEPFHTLLDEDTHAGNVTAAMRKDGVIEPGPSYIDKNRYISREYHELEKKYLWSRVWQQAAHEDDFPNVGDVVPYDIVDKSYLVVRVGKDEYKAYYNACLHRGRKLREERGKGLDELRCSFHGWAWNLDGSIKQVPCAYDYTDLCRSKESLPEVKVGRWGRYIFINPDPDCEPFEQFLGNLSDEFAVLPYECRYKRAHVSKVIRANWKVAQEAFMESYHLLMTHPQGMTGGANDICTKYDSFGNYSRAIRPGVLSGAALPVWEPIPDSEKATLRHPLNGSLYEDVGEETVRVTTPKGVTGLFTAQGQYIEGELKDASQFLCILVGGPKVSSGPIAASVMADLSESEEQRLKQKLGEDASLRAMSAELYREMLAEVIPTLAPSIPDAELTCSIYLTVFPNFHPWGSFEPINYRFRPNGDNHDECIMEVMMMAPIPENGDYEPAREIRYLGVDDNFLEAEAELGPSAPIFNQDTLNMPCVHEGMKASARSYIRLSEYNETKIRHFHKLYDQWVDGQG